MLRKDNALFSILRMICWRALPVLLWLPLNAFGATLDDDACHLSVRRVSASSETIFLLDTVTLTYEISHNASCRLEVEPIAHQSIVCFSQGDTLISADETTQKHTASIACRYQNPGIFYTIPVIFNAIDQNHITLSKVYAESYRVDVQGYLPGFDETSPLHSELKWLPWKTGLGKLAAIILSFCALDVIILIVIHRRRKREETAQAPESVSLSPMERFRREVGRVSGWKLETLEETKTYYTILSLALRRFVGDWFKFDAMPMTTAQLCEQLEGNALPQEALKRLRKLLDQSDYIKYFKPLPSDSSNRAFLNEATTCAETIQRLLEDRQAAQTREESSGVEILKDETENLAKESPAEEK